LIIKKYFMRKFYVGLWSVIAAVVGWLIGKWLGSLVYSAYKRTGDMVTAEENISLNFIFPIITGLVLCLFVYFLLSDES